MAEGSRKFNFEMIKYKLDYYINNKKGKFNGLWILKGY